MLWAATAPNLSVCLNGSKTSTQGTGLGARILEGNQHGAAGTPAPPLFQGFSPKSLMNKGTFFFFPGTILPPANAPPFLSLLQSSTGGKGKQNTSFLFETLPCEASPKLTLSQGGGASQPSLPGSAPGRAGTTKGRVPSLSYPRPGICSGRALCSESQYLPIWFYQFLVPALRYFFFCSPRPRLIFLMQRLRLAGTVPKAC